MIIVKTLTEHNKDKQPSFKAVIGEKAEVLCPACKTEMIYSKAGYNKRVRGYYVFCPNEEERMNEEWIFIGIKL